jgi:hypothetical protein
MSFENKRGTKRRKKKKNGVLYVEKLIFKLFKMNKK